MKSSWDFPWSSHVISIPLRLLSIVLHDFSMFFNVFPIISASVSHHVPIICHDFTIIFQSCSHHFPMILPFVPPFWSATPRDFFPCLQGRGPVARWRLAGQPHQSRVLGRSRGAGERGGKPGASWRWIWRFHEVSINGGPPILGTPHIFSKTTGWGPLQIPSQVEIWLWLNSMVYGRYNELVHGGYEPTNITGGHHSAGVLSWLQYI